MVAVTLKRRIVPVQLLLGDRLVKTVRFGEWRDVGDPVKSSQVYYSQDADELVLINIARDNRDPYATAAYVSRITESCFMPIAVGGGIRTIDHAAALFAAGADKVTVNSAAYDNPALVREIADRHGSQAIVVSIDVRRAPNGEYRLAADCGRDPRLDRLEDHIARAVAHGAGEILLNAIDRDGVREGYDIDLLTRARAVCRVPIVLCGGAGDYTHLLTAFQNGADAAACGSLFNFADNNPLRAKAFLKNYGIPLKRV